MAEDTQSRAGHFDLYFHPYSICSIMVLYTSALRGNAKDAESEMIIHTREVDIFHEEQFEEHFLCDINPKGQVPVLSSPLVKAPIPDSLEMTFYMATRYPHLIPAEHETQIRRSLVDLHALNYFSLSFPGRQHVAQGFREAVLRRLGAPDLSDRYRKALEFKLTVVDREKVQGLRPSETARMQRQAEELLTSLETLCESPDRWLFGEKPTALDAHLVVFIARMIDVGQQKLIPKKLQDYDNWAVQGAEWNKIMNGRRTMMQAPSKV